METFRLFPRGATGGCGCAAALILAGSLTASGANAAEIQISDVGAGTGGFLIKGPAGSSTGTDLSGGGDINGDGLSDVIVGMPVYLIEGSPRVFGGGIVVFGRSATSPVLATSPAALGGDGFQFLNDIDYTAGQGSSVTNAGDVNGDGLADFVVGSGQDAAVSGTSGEAFVVFGRTSVAPVSLSSVRSGTGGFVIRESSQVGPINDAVVAGVGDVNGDGLADVLTAGTGFSFEDAGRPPYLIFGKADTAPVEYSDLDAGSGGFAMVWVPEARGIEPLVSGAGDVNGDGLMDMIVSDDSIKYYVVFGKSTTTPVAMTAVEAGTGGFAIIGNLSPGSNGTRKATGIGDLNGDGLSDILLRASLARARNPLPHVVFGKSTTTSVQLSDVDAGTGGFPVAIADNSLVESAYYVNPVGDINGDGLADLGLSSTTNDSGVQYFVVFGQSTGPMPTFDELSNGTGGFSIKDTSPTVVFYPILTAAGDVNGDGTADLLLAPWSVALGLDTAFVVFGPGPVAPVGTYRTHVAAGDTDPTGIGTHRYGNDRTIFPDSRCWVDFNGGSGPGLAGSSLVNVTLTRSKAGVSSLGASQLANSVWQITTDRTGFTNARVTFQYTNAEIAGLAEGSLRILRGTNGPNAPWKTLANITIDTARNQISGDTPGFSHFVIVQNNVLSVDLTAFSARAESASSPVSITWTTAAEFDTAGFHVESAPNATGPWSRVTSTLIPAEGSAVAGATYSVVDEAPIGAGAARWYRLSETVLDGATITYDPAQAAVGGNASSVTAWTLY